MLLCFFYLEVLLPYIIAVNFPSPVVLLNNVIPKLDFFCWCLFKTSASLTFDMNNFCCNTCLIDKVSLYIICIIYFLLFHLNMNTVDQSVAVCVRSSFYLFLDCLLLFLFCFLPCLGSSA